MKQQMTAYEIKKEIEYNLEQIKVVFSKRHVAGTDFSHNCYVITQHIVNVRELQRKAKYA